MLIIKIPIEFNKSNESNQIYKFYLSNLSRYRSAVLRKLRSRKYDKLYNDKLLNSNLLMFRSTVDSDTLFSDIVKYAVHNICIYSDRTGDVFYYIPQSVYNPFCKNVTFDCLVRIIEFGGDSIKPTRIFRDAMDSIKSSLDKIYKLAYKDRRYK